MVGVSCIVMKVVGGSVVERLIVVEVCSLVVDLALMLIVVVDETLLKL